LRAAEDDAAMLTRIDRMILAVHDRYAASQAWQRLVGAEVVREDRLRFLAAERVVLRVGESELEILDPDGIGATAQFLSRYRTAILGVGFAVADLGAAQARLDARGIHHVREGQQLLLSGEWSGVPALRVALTQDEKRPAAGLLSRIYEATLLTQDHRHAARRIARAFELEPRNFVPIRSEPFGYAGTLALLQHDALDRIETVTPFDGTKTMGRFFARQGPSLYMFYAEARDPVALRVRLEEHATGNWSGPREGTPDNLFVHPKALNGALLGVSRESVAWTWTGHPERVRPAA
jgi:hypothetical protein